MCLHIIDIHSPAWAKILAHSAATNLPTTIRRKPLLRKLFEVDPIGIEPTTSTLPV